jgi:hypothetical protein
MGRFAMIQALTGTVHGKTILLTTTPGIADGQEVEVVIRPKAHGEQSGEGIMKSAGGWAAYPEMDEIMDQIHRERALERRPSSAP